MKLEELELTNVKSAGNQTNLTGGKIPNAFTDDASKASKKPRKKKKDVYGTNAHATGVSSGADGGDGSGGGGE